MEAIAVIRETPKFVYGSLIENFIRVANSLLAKASKWPEERTRWEVFGPSYAKKSFQRRPQSLRHVPLVHVLTGYKFPEQFVSAVMIGD